jgi:hypothetical protein
MPYILQYIRAAVEIEIQDMGLSWIPGNAGELNFVVSTFVANYIRETGLKYAHLNEMVGALECAKLELQRVVIGPYEDLKIAENGGVYGGILPTATY